LGPCRLGSMELGESDATIVEIRLGTSDHAIALYESEARMGSRPVEPGLVDPKVNIRILLAAFWIGHFLLWTFGDMFTVAQEMGEPATSTLILFVAPSTALVQALMIVTSLVGRPVYARWANMILASVYLLFNIGFFVDATQGWEYYLGIGYVLFNVLIFWHAYRWPTDEENPRP
jgi:hypothetical protein